MTTSRLRHYVISLFAVSLFVISCGISRSDNINDDTTRLPTEIGSDTTVETGNKFLDFDTGTGPMICQGEWMTTSECLAVSGVFDINFLRECEDQEEIRCCLAGETSTPCTETCMGAQWQCEEVGGSVNGEVCPFYNDVCCAGAQIPEPDTGEAFDIDTDCPVASPVTAADQPSKLASGICVEMRGEDGEIFCQDTDYDRIVADLAAIDAAFPVMQEDAGGQEWSVYGGGEIPFSLLCAPASNNTCNGLPEDTFEGLGTCLGTQDFQCLFRREEDGTCGIMIAHFEVGVNAKKIFDLFQDHARSVYAGSFCELNKFTFVNDPLNGYHVEVTADGSTWWWKLRARAEFQMDFSSNCDVRIEFFTVPGSSDPLSITIDNQSKPECTIEAFTSLK